MGLDLSTLERVWEWSKGQIGLWLRALSDPREVIVEYDLNATETLIEALRFSLFPVLLALLIDFPGETYRYKGAFGLPQLATSAIFYYLGLFIVSLAHCLSARIFFGKVTLKAAIILALFGSAYLPLSALMTLIFTFDLEHVRHITMSLDQVPLFSRKETIFAWLNMGLHLFIMSRFIRSVAFLNRIGWFRAILVTVCAGALTLAAMGIVSQNAIWWPPGSDNP